MLQCNIIQMSEIEKFFLYWPVCKNITWEGDFTVTVLSWCVECTVTVVSWQCARYWVGRGRGVLRMWCDFLAVCQYWSSILVGCRQCECSVQAVWLWCPGSVPGIELGVLRIWCDIFLGIEYAGGVQAVWLWCPGNVPVLIGGLFQNVTVISWQYCICWWCAGVCSIYSPIASWFQEYWHWSADS